ncbi:hypothetical protein [Prosthecobacter fluviatilis]|uniref:Uncharacterized protein n=1 Tax=Prosthecobacter fluviatilis TaxID=445931 RepID=A0ABW0KMC5_9BACT
MRAHRHHSRPLTRLVHLLLLAGWLLSSQGIAPAICMAAALIDGDHAVKVGVSNEEGLTVVLSHAGKSTAELSRHQHDALCRFLMAFAVTPESSASDHILAFKSVDEASRAQQQQQSPTQGIAQTVIPVTVLDCRFARPSPDQAVAARLLRGSWSHGLALRSGRTVMRC